MSEIFPTTMHPSKHELIGPWLLNQPWFSGVGTPELENVGGFRLDDPAGEVGMEFIFVRDNASPAHVVYHVPLTYRGAPLKGAESALLGTSEHGVLGTRWIYDAAADPVWHTALTALAAGEVLAQHQKISNTLEPDVHVHSAPLEATTPDVPAHWSIIRRPEAEGMGQSRAGTRVSVPWVTAGELARAVVLEIA